MKQITVLIADDHLILREGLRTLFRAEGDIKIIGEAKNGQEAILLAKQLRPDVILMDIAMPLMNGFESVRQIHKILPTAKILILSAYADDEYVERMTMFGAAGYVVKQTSLDALAKGIREVYKGNTFFSPSISKRIQQRYQKILDRKGSLKGKMRVLSSRESEILQLIAEGSANKQMAAELGISIKTVEKHRQHLMEKLNIHDTAGLTRYAIATGVIESSSQTTFR